MVQSVKVGLAKQVSTDGWATSGAVPAIAVREELAC